MSVSGYSKIENDKIDITISRIKSIAMILDTDIETILHFDPKNAFRSYNKRRSANTTNRNQDNLHGSVDRILANMQRQIDELKK